MLPRRPFLRRKALRFSALRFHAYPSLPRAPRADREQGAPRVVEVSVVDPALVGPAATRHVAQLAKNEAMAGMTTEALAIRGGMHGKAGEYRAIALVS